MIINRKYALFQEVKFFVSEKYRVYAILSFAVILYGVGLPVWWYTTAVQRVTLPYDGIAALSDLETRIQTRLLVGSTSRERGATLARELSAHFGHEGALYLHNTKPPITR